MKKFISDFRSAIKTAKASDILFSWSFWTIIISIVCLCLNLLSFAFAFGVISILTSIVCIIFVQKEKNTEGDS